MAKEVGGWGREDTRWNFKPSLTYTNDCSLSQRFNKTVVLKCGYPFSCADFIVTTLKESFLCKCIPRQKEMETQCHCNSCGEKKRAVNSSVPLWWVFPLWWVLTGACASQTLPFQTLERSSLSSHFPWVDCKSLTENSFGKCSVTGLNIGQWSFSAWDGISEETV